MTTQGRNLPEGSTVALHLVRRNGSLEQVFTSLAQAERYMKATRKNGEFWRISSTATQPHENKP
jgi:type II secretory pathway component PulL